MQTLTVTSGKLWRKPREEGIELMMPSQNVARLRPLSMDWFLSQAQIPDVLTPIIMAVAEGRDIGDDPKAEAALEKLAKDVKFLNDLAKHSFVSPRIVENPQADDEISAADVDYQDKLFLLQFIGTPAVALERFREQQIRAVETLRAIQTHQPESGDDHEDPTVGEPEAGDDGQLDTATV